MPKPIPSNATYAAAELAHAAPSCLPMVAARVATELCSLGRCYQLAREDIHDAKRCAGAEERSERLLSRAVDLLEPFGDTVRIETTGDGLVMLLRCGVRHGSPVSLGSLTRLS